MQSLTLRKTLVALAALTVIGTASAQSGTPVTDGANPVIEQLKRELADQRKLIQQLLDAQQAKTPVASGASVPSASATTPADPTKPAFTFYGTLDINVMSADSGFGSKTTVGTGGMTASRLGVKGEKALGGDLKAIGEFEAGLAIDTGVVANGATTAGVNATNASSGGLIGNGGQLFSRQAYVGLANNFGALTLGRQYTASYMSAAGYGPAMGPGFLGNGGLLLPNIGGMPTRLNNSIVYKTPTIRGFSGQLSYSTGSENNLAVDTTAGATVTNDQAGQGYDLGLFYIAGPLTVGLTTWAVNAASYALVGETGLAKKNGAQLVANYDFGFMKLHGAYVSGTINGGNYENVTKTLSSANGSSVSASFPFGKNKVYVSYSELNDQSPQNKNANLVGLAYTYELAPGQKLYASMGKMNNSSKASYSLADGGDLVGNVATAGFSPSAFMVGLNLTF